MSVWSRTHADLAQLARTMQARNALTRQRLSRRRKLDESRGDEARVRRSRSAGTLSACGSSTSLEESEQGSGECEYSACNQSHKLVKVSPLDTFVDSICHPGEDDLDQKRASNQEDELDNNGEDKLAAHCRDELDFNQDNKLPNHQESDIPETEFVRQQKYELVRYQDRLVRNNDITGVPNKVLDSTESRDLTLWSKSSTVKQGNYKDITMLKEVCADSYSGDREQHVSEHIAIPQCSERCLSHTDRLEAFLSPFPSFRTSGAKTEVINNDATIGGHDESSFDTLTTVFHIELPDSKIEENFADNQSACNNSSAKADTEKSESNSLEESKITSAVSGVSKATLGNIVIVSSGGDSTMPTSVYSHLYMSPPAKKHCETILTFSTKLRVSSTVDQSNSEIVLSAERLPGHPSHCSPFVKCSISEEAEDTYNISQDKTCRCTLGRPTREEDSSFQVCPRHCQQTPECINYQAYLRKCNKTYECSNCQNVSNGNIVRDDNDHQRAVSSILSLGLKYYTHEEDAGSLNCIADAAIDTEHREVDGISSRNTSLIDYRKLPLSRDNSASCTPNTGNVETVEKCSEDDTNFSNDTMPESVHSAGCCQRTVPEMQFNRVPVDGPTEELHKNGSCSQCDNGDVTLINSRLDSVEDPFADIVCHHRGNLLPPDRSRSTEIFPADFQSDENESATDYTSGVKVHDGSSREQNTDSNIVSDFQETDVNEGMNLPCNFPPSVIHQRFSNVYYNSKLAISTVTESPRTSAYAINAESRGVSYVSTPPVEILETSGSSGTIAYASDESPGTSPASRIDPLMFPFNPHKKCTEHLALDASSDTKPCVLFGESLINSNSECSTLQSHDTFAESCFRDGEPLVHSMSGRRQQQNYDNELVRDVVIPASESVHIMNVESEGLMDLLSTLRVMRDKLRHGQGVAQCALLLHRLESSKAFSVLEQTPTFFAITDDLKQLCQTLTRSMENREPASAIHKQTIFQAPKGHRVSSWQLERCRLKKTVARKAFERRSLKTKYDKVNGVLNKTKALADYKNKVSFKNSHQDNKKKRISVQPNSIFSQDGGYVPKCSEYDSFELKGKAEALTNQKCYVPDCTGQLELSSTESAILFDSSSPLSVSDHFSDMESESELGYQLDHEFDKHLADMKPHVLNLPHKTERQKSAVWIKKLCEPVRGGVTARKTRNLYAQLMLQMLKKGELGTPFDQKPEPGALKPLPSYLIEKLPDWVEGELAETVGSSIFTKTLGIPAATSTWVSSTADFLERPHTSMGHTLDKDPSLSPIRHAENTQPRYSADDMSIQLQRSPKTSRRHHKAQHSPSGDREKRQLPDVRVKEARENGKMNEVTTNEGDWSKPYSSTTSSTFSLPKGTTFYDDPSFLKPADREIAMRAKMIEAKFHEEKLKLQQKHDAAVQKILDRKNSEIEDVKNLYRSKSKDMEDTINKLERKVQTLMKETEFIRQSKDKQISELRKIADDSNETRRNEYEKKLHEVITEFEQEKFELQKQHTQNIQEILDDTNDRLQRMEAEYTNQTNITTDVIKELESRVQQLMNEVDSSLSQRSAVEKEKNDVLMKCEKLSNENERLRERFAQQEKDQLRVIESQEHEIKSLKNKTEASLEYLRQEHSMAASKAADTIRELEEKVDQLKKSLKETEEHRQRQIREMEQNHQQDKVHLENLHDKQVRNLKKELEQLDGDWSKKVSKLDQVVKDKEQELTRVREQKHQQKLQSEQALEDFKSEIERNQNKIYDEMKQQMQQVEVDLQKSKQAREKQAKEFVKQLEDEKYSHQHELAELKMTYEADKSQFMREFHMQKEFLISEHERDIENLKELHRTEVLSLEARMKEKQDKAEKSAIDSERGIRELREELLQANQLRKQQLVELGLLREEEKQKMHRDHEAELARVRAEMEQQRLALQRTHSSEMETVLEKANQRLSTLEKDFTDRANKSSETITELQTVIKQLRDELQRCKDSYENKMADLRRVHEEEKKTFKKKFSHNLEAVKNELEIQKNRGSNAERRLQKAESDVEERLMELKLHYEEKIRGLVPSDVKKELEDTIVALKSQVNSLQMRSSLLQEELDSRSGLASFGNLASTAIKSAV